MPLTHLVVYVVAGMVASVIAWLINYLRHPRWFSPPKVLAAILAMLVVAAFLQYELQGDGRKDRASDAPQTPSSPPHGGTSGSARAVAYLADLIPQSNQTFTSGAATLSGKTYPRSALISCFYRDVFAEYDLGRSKSTLSVKIGIDDKMPSDSIAYVMIYGDDQPLGGPRTVRSGGPLPLSLDVSRVLHLKFVCSPKEGQEGRFRLVLGDAKVF